MSNNKLASPRPEKRRENHTLLEYVDIRSRSYADPDIQRRDCWDIEMRQEFIQTLFGDSLGCLHPIALVEVESSLNKFRAFNAARKGWTKRESPEMEKELSNTILYYGTHRENSVENIILDGLQRGTTLHMLVSDMIEIPAGTVFDRDGIYHEFKKGTYWRDVPNSIKNWAEQRECVEVLVLKNLTRSRLEEQFVRIQKGLPLNIIETVSARFSPEFGEHVKSVAQDYEAEFKSFDSLNFLRKGDIALVAKVAMSVDAWSKSESYCGTKDKDVVSAWSGTNAISLSADTVDRTSGIINAFFRCAESVDEGVFNMATKWQGYSLLMTLISAFTHVDDIQIRDYGKFTTDIMEVVSDIHTRHIQDFANALAAWNKKPFSYRSSDEGKAEKPKKSQYFHHHVSNAEIKSSRQKAAYKLIEELQPIFNQLEAEGVIIFPPAEVEVV